METTNKGNILLGLEDFSIHFKPYIDTPCFTEIPLLLSALNK